MGTKIKASLAKGRWTTVGGGGILFINGENMTELKLHDIVIMKKPHPCGCKEFEILRLGVDYRLKCCGCGREVMVPRIKAEKNIRGVKNV